jgi:cbb3-type cytochrome oxidase maturation protein
MLYYLPWIFLIIISISISLAGFLWATKTGQFSDQTRARYLPLADGLSPSVPECRSHFRLEIYFLMIILATGIVAMLAAVYLILTR